jgi:chitodextrinase
MKTFSVKHGTPRLLVFFVAVLSITGYAAGNGFAENIAKDAPGGLAEGSLYNGTGNAYGILGSVTGIVTDVDGTALSAVMVRIGEAMDITAGNGEYTIKNIVKGKGITITATGDGYEPYAGIVDVEKKTESIINIMMTPIPAEPDPVTAEPDPVTTEPAPVATEPDPIATEPDPIATEPDPIATEPDPIATKPIGSEPAPVATEPDPVATEPDPVTAEPDPVPTEPDPVPTEPIGSGLDITPPEAVTGLLTKVVSSSRIDLSWNPSTDGDGSGVAGYRVYRDGVETGTSTSTVYSDTGLFPATAYCYTVTAYDTEGNESTAGIQACTATSPLQTHRPVTLLWDAPTTNEEGAPLDDLAGYRLYYGTSTGNYTESFDAANVTQYTVGNLPTGLYYYFAVTAYDTQGNESAYSTEISTYLSR